VLDAFFLPVIVVSLKAYAADAAAGTGLRGRSDPRFPARQGTTTHQYETKLRPNAQNVGTFCCTRLHTPDNIKVKQKPLLGLILKARLSYSTICPDGCIAADITMHEESNRLLSRTGAFAEGRHVIG
jgi:hypothetical protein